MVWEGTKSFMVYIRFGEEEYLEMFMSRGTLGILFICNSAEKLSTHASLKNT